MENILILVVVLMLLDNTVSTASRNRCESATTCTECLEADGACYWCADSSYLEQDGSNKPRCNLRNMLAGCNDVQITDGEVRETEC